MQIVVMLFIPPDLARSALESTPDAMIIIDVKGVIRYANRQVTTLFGYAHDEIIGKRIEQLMPNRFRELHIAHREQYARQLRLRPMGTGLELLGRGADGTEFPVEISLSPIDSPGEGQALVAAAIREVTDRKRIEADLVAARRSAEHAREVADVARESADRANRSKSRFLATASHDLRLPLQRLALLNRTLRRTVSDTGASEVLAQQEQAIDAMSRVLNALLDVSKLESGVAKPDLTDFAVATIFEELERELAPLAVGKGLRLEIEESAECAHTDLALIAQILRNLVSNAIKYTRQGRVRLSCVATPDSLVRIEVEDTGVGIPADQLANIFDEFYRVDAANTPHDGYGLGLSIVKRIAALLGLKVEVRSEVGHGSSFTLLLPPADRPVAASRRLSSSPVTREGLTEQRRVLLVEDDPSVRAATYMLLRGEGYRVTAVSSLAEALRVAGSGERFDLLIADYHLRNGETGTQVIAAVREVLAAPVKAVLFTGDTSSSVRGLPQDSRLRVASKPIRAEELLSLVKGLLDTG
jgi:PAS domain S-box-containing protein